MQDSVLEAFGHTIDIPNLCLDVRGGVTLDMGAMGQLGVKRTQDQVVVYLMRTLHFPTPRLLRYALESCHPLQNHPLSVTAGLYQAGGLALMTRFSLEAWSLPDLETAIQVLNNLHNRIANAPK